MKIAALLLFFLLGSVAWAQPMCARSNTTLRKGPGEKNEVTWKVTKNMPFLRLERKSGWLKLQDLEGEVHWGKASDFTTKTRCVVVKTNVAALHKEPSLNSPPPELKTLDRYTPLKRVNDQRDWLEVEVGPGVSAWIHESQVWKPVIVNSFSF